jgi:hypothetical protein
MTNFYFFRRLGHQARRPAGLRACATLRVRLSAHTSCPIGHFGTRFARPSHRYAARFARPIRFESQAQKT